MGSFSLPSWRENATEGRVITALVIRLRKSTECSSNRLQRRGANSSSTATSFSASQGAKVSNCRKVV
jgi:hypothetical protein